MAATTVDVASKQQMKLQKKIYLCCVHYPSSACDNLIMKFNFRMYEMQISAAKIYQNLQRQQCGKHGILSRSVVLWLCGLRKLKIVWFGIFPLCNFSKSTSFRSRSLSLSHSFVRFTFSSCTILVSLVFLFVICF